MHLLLSLKDRRLVLTSDYDVVDIAPSRTFWVVTPDMGERWGKVDCRVGLGLDSLDLLSRPARDESVHGKF